MHYLQAKLLYCTQKFDTEEAPGAPFTNMD